jgi:glycine/D-amino acid oxidase-like deaminating enzyme
MSEQLDYIIVGQGIAGSMVAHFLLQKGKKILVIDQYNPTSSSNIAAGVVNPVTGRKMVKTWMIDDLLPFAKKTYSALEKQLQVSFFL